MRHPFPTLAVLAFLLPALAAAPVVTYGARPEVKPRSVDRILVIKHKRLMHLMVRGRIVRTYRIALGFAPKGHKTQEGDGKTPEGTYRIDLRNPKSRFTLSLRISYPNRADRAQARRRGVSPGGQIFIHGLPTGAQSVGAAHRLRDWTLGCIAVTSAEIREIWRLVPVGAVIEIRP